MIGWLPARWRWRWLLLVPIAGIAALIEAAGALAVFGLLRLVVEPEQVRTAPVVSGLFRLMPDGYPPAPLVAVLAFSVAVFYILRAAFLSWAEWVRMGTVYGSSAIAAERLFARYLAADYLFHVKRRSASLIEPMTRATDIAYELCAGSAVNILAEVVTIAALAAVLIVSSPPITVITVAVVLAFVLVPIVMTRRSSERIGAAERDALSAAAAPAAAKPRRHQGRQGHRPPAVLRGALPGRQARARCHQAAPRDVGHRGAPGRGSHADPQHVDRGLPGDAQPPSRARDIVSVLALFAYTGFRVVPSANRIMLNVGYMREAHPWIRGMDEDMRRLKLPPARPYEHVPPMLQSTLACEDVSFRYEDAPALALDHITFTIARGQSIGIVGPTGAGKSTLVDLLLGLLAPTSGRVMIDGQSLEGRERAWQRQIGYVPQDVYLLDDSLRRNIAFGIPDGAIDERRLAFAVTQARLDEVVMGLPNLLETVIGENGVRLSGGQRQRVAIARALYHDPPVLVFDEATAALDNQTEREVTEAIAYLSRGFGGQANGPARAR